MLDPSVRGGLLAADDGSVDPRLLAAALLTAAEGAGARLIRAASVAEISCAAGRASGVRARRRQAGHARPRIVLAAGWQSAALPGLPAGIAPPVRPVKGQIIRLRTHGRDRAAGLPPGLLQRTVRGIVRGSSVYLVPRDSGELVIGATQEELGPGHDGDRGRRLGAAARRPDARARHHRAGDSPTSVAGLRPGTPDNAPVIGPSQLPGLVLATGHFRAGVLLAPVTADTVAALPATGTPIRSGRPFAADRFRVRGGQPPRRARR